MRQKTQTLNHHHFLTITIILQDSTFEQNYEDEDGFSNVFPLWRDFNPTHPRKWTFFVTLFKKELISDIAYVTLCTIFMCHSYYKINDFYYFQIVAALEGLINWVNTVLDLSWIISTMLLLTSTVSIVTLLRRMLVLHSSMLHIDHIGRGRPRSMSGTGCSWVHCAHCGRLKNQSAH